MSVKNTNPNAAAVSSFIDVDLLSKLARVSTCTAASVSRIYSIAMFKHSSSQMLECHYTSISNRRKQFSDRDKLCQLLEQHQKLMQMLQEWLGQL
ncbi:protein virilizer homolog isoform X4 [Arachis duranensis]|uniref:Protein virilizer homolog isoform X4 n=1 Tax=Arachis duranensis TaxID=130453 RepID=A0A6P5N5Z8_ARADU|nr:protein virilizer homolog isoform X4 [Arachis duranensis]